MHLRAYVTATNSGGSATAYTYPTGKVTGGSEVPTADRAGVAGWPAWHASEF